MMYLLPYNNETTSRANARPSLTKQQKGPVTMAKFIKAKSKRVRKSLTQARLQELLHYNPDTGVFTRRIGGHGIKGGVGAHAGCDSFVGYRVISLDNCLFYAHRLAWLYIYGKWPIAFTDHANGDKSDNRLCNLREATTMENGRNRKIGRNNTSGYKGVVFIKSHRKWRAAIKIDGIYKYIGEYENAKDAHAAYCSAAMFHFGSFARIN